MVIVVVEQQQEEEVVVLLLVDACRLWYWIYQVSELFVNEYHY